MKTLYIIPVHSYVDIITNSSSELFIGRTDKSVEAVKEILLELIRMEYRKQVLAGDTDGTEHFNAEARFQNYFGDIFVNEYDFNPADCPDYEAYAEVHDWEAEKYHPIYIKCKQEWDAVCKTNPNNRDYPKVWAPWNDYKREKLLKVLKWAFKNNNLEWDYKPEESWWNEESSFWKKAIPFVHALDWDYVLRKGNILIYSRTDNSIPYEMWPDIERIFNADRRHLG